MNIIRQRHILVSLIGVNLCVFFIAIGCSSPSVDPLPQESQSGQNIIGCRIDGEVWLPSFDFSRDFKRGGTGRIARYSTKKKTLYVGGTNENTGGSINLSLANCSQEGTYSLDDRSTDLMRPVSNSGSFSPSGYIGEDTYWTTSQYSGQVVITKLTNQIVSGRFSFTAWNQNTGKTVHVTDGRFDFFYSPGVDD